MTRPIPKAAKAVGILCLVFGIASLMGAVFFAQAMAGPVRAMIADPAQQSDGYTHAIQLGAAVVSRALMVTGGAGLLLGRRWGRWTALAYGGFTIGLVVTSLFVRPEPPKEMPEAFSQMLTLGDPSEAPGAPQPIAPTAVQQAWTVAVSLFLPVLTIALLMRRDVREAYGAPPSSAML